MYKRQEDSSTKYGNIVAVKEGQESSAKTTALVEALTSDTVRQFIVDEFGETAVPMFLSLIHISSISTITLIGYSAMAGTVGGGGLGDIAIRYGYQRYQQDVMIVTIILLVIIVQLIQFAFGLLASAIDKRNH